jgi:uroporphyrinogen III methyltransferase/synthase
MNGAFNKQRQGEEAKSELLLSGKRIVITRARSQAGDFARRIEELGGEVIDFPTIEIQSPESYAPLDAAIGSIENYDWLIFTSVNGVERFLARLQKVDGSLKGLAHTQVAAIGPETARRLKAAGLVATVMPKEYIAEGLLEVFTPEMMRGKRVLIPRAAKARHVLPETLRQWGATVDVVAAYRTVLPVTDVSSLRSLLLERKIDLIAFTSSSTVSNFVKLFQAQSLSEILGETAVACIGPITKRTVEELGGQATVVSQEFTIPGLVRAIVNYFEPGRGQSSE